MELLNIKNNIPNEYKQGIQTLVKNMAVEIKPPEEQIPFYNSTLQTIVEALPEDSRYDFWIAVSNEDPVAYLISYTDLVDGVPVYEVMQVFIDEGFRGKKEIILFWKDIERYAKQRGCFRLSVPTVRTPEAVQKLIKRRKDVTTLSILSYSLKEE